MVQHYAQASSERMCGSEKRASTSGNCERAHTGLGALRWASCALCTHRCGHGHGKGGVGVAQKRWEKAGKGDKRRRCLLEPAGMV